MANLGKVVYLTSAQYSDLYTNGTITVDGVTITYSANDVYMVQDTSSAVPATTTANQVLKSTSSSGVTQWGSLSASDVGAQPTLPTTTTAGKVLKSTSTAGTVQWGDDSGALPTPSSELQIFAATNNGSWRYPWIYSIDIDTYSSVPLNFIKDMEELYRDQSNIVRYFIEFKDDIDVSPENDSDNGQLQFSSGDRLYLEKSKDYAFSQGYERIIQSDDGSIWLIKLTPKYGTNTILSCSCYLISTWGIGANEYTPKGGLNEDIYFEIATDENGSDEETGNEYPANFGFTAPDAGHYMFEQPKDLN